MNAPATRPIITLTTDFGADSSYVAQMKGVILSRNPAACLVDITHSIAPQDIRGGALILADSCPRFPARTIHVVVVDPGVGTDRQIVFAQIGAQRFVAPNNGLLTLLAEREKSSQLIEVTNPLYFLPTISHTFHGRDILAPVAAHLSLGLNPKRLGNPLPSLLVLSFPRPTVQPGRIVGQVIHIDSFGNLITNISSAELANVTTPDSAIVQCKSAQVNGLASTYGSCPLGSLIAVVGSSGRLELAIVNGNAAAQLAAGLDESVTVQW